MCKLNSVNIKFLILIAFISGVLTGCLNTEESLKIKGKVSDEKTKKGIPRKNIIVQGLILINNKFVPVEAGQFSTDSTGCFTYTLRKVKDYKNYRFCFVGDSDNLFTTNEMTLFDLEQNAVSLSFSLRKLTDLTINLKRISRKPVSDTLSLSWESDGVYFWFLYPYKIYDYGRKNFSYGPTWIGGGVNSTINTKVFADKMTKISWELYRYGRRKKFTDTITCRRDITNIVYFTY